MSEEITLVYNTEIYTASSGGWEGYARVWVNPLKQGQSPDYQSAYNSGTVNWALVLDRKDPTKPPLFNGKISSNTEPPADLKALMTPAHILLYMTAGHPNSTIPQGDLFTMLQLNGAGAELKKLERLAYFNGCGMAVPVVYTLVSVPGSSLPGIEHMAKGGVGASSDRKTSVSVFGNLQNLISLVPGADGYAPIEVG